jgi:hypothetical protein
MKIGDFVGVKHETTKGYVLTVDKDKVVIKTDDDFELTYLKRELIVYQSDLDKDNSIIKKNLSNATSKKNVKKNKPIDLHYDGNYLKSNEILPYQISVFKKEINHAIQKKWVEITFIHGLGEGKLKLEIERILIKNGFNFSDAPYTQFGQDAAIIVYLKNNTKLIL